MLEDDLACYLPFSAALDVAKLHSEQHLICLHHAHELHPESLGIP